MACYGIRRTQPDVAPARLCAWVCSLAAPVATLVSPKQRQRQHLNKLAPANVQIKFINDAKSPYPTQ